MEKRPVPSKPVATAPKKARPKPPPDQGDTLVGAADSKVPLGEGQQLAQTEAFTMTSGDEPAGDFRVDQTEAPPAPKKAAKATRLASTEAFDRSQLQPPPRDLGQTEAFDQSQPPPASKAMDRTVATTQGPHSKPAVKVQPPQPVAAQPKSTMLGDYKLLKKLGQGGMGSVYKALQVSLEREVAVKVLSKELASKPAFVQRFLREARVMAKLDHPNILRCYDVGAFQGFHYLSMEFVEGGSVETWLKKLGKFSIGDALYIIIACAHALQHAHELNLVHRDIKPDNILLTKKGVVKVADLGLAKAQDDDMSLTKTGTGAGTPLFMAPEQARDVKRVDGRCDIYSLGGMLYNFLAGQPPFIGETLVELIEAKEKGKFKPVRDFNDEVPERLDLIVAKLLSTKPEHRYQTCAALILELDNLGLANSQLSFLGDPGPAARPAAPPPPAKKVAVPGMTRSTRGTPAPATKETSKPETGDFYYATFAPAKGKTVTRKLTKEQMNTLIKSKSFNEGTQVSRTLKGGYRALGTYKEFQHFFKGQDVRETADRKGQKYRKLYEQIEKEDVRRRRWRWLHNSFLRFGGFVGLILWLLLIGLLLTGVFFGLRWGLTEMGVELPF